MIGEDNMRATMEAQCTNVHASSSDTARAEAKVTPKADVFESATGFSVSVDIPGVLPEDVEVSIEQQILAIHARRHITDERSVRFMRKFRLSSALDPEAITCTLEHGVLHLTLPKAKSAQPRKVDVIVPT